MAASDRLILNILSIHLPDKEIKYYQLWLPCFFARYFFCIYIPQFLRTITVPTQKYAYIPQA
jgi:hypothetical protein